MSLPENKLSSSPVPSYFIGARAQVFPDYVDYMDGGAGIQDPSLGLDYQMWTAEIVRDELADSIVLSAPTYPREVVYSGADITEVSLAFNQAMQLCIAFVEQGVSKLLWYDSSILDMTVTVIGADAVTPKVALDDSREFNRANSDVILAYIKNGALYYRQQRDRFGVERQLSSGPWVALKRIGMGANLRFQFQVVAP